MATRIEIGDSFHKADRPKPIYTAQYEHQFNGRRYVFGLYKNGTQGIGIDLPEDQLVKCDPPKWRRPNR